MKGVAALLLLVIVLIVVGLGALNWFAEGQAELRSEEAQQALEQMRLLAPLWLAVKRVAIASLGIASGSLAMILAVVAIATLFATPNLVRATWVRSWLVKPGRYGAQYPALAVPDRESGHIRILPPVNEPGAQKVAALTTGLQPDVRLQGSAARAALRNDPNETIMPESEPLLLPPPKASIYTAPISDQLHLAVGVDGHGPVQLPLRDLGSGIVGGLPGMGKSEAVASMIAGLLRQDSSGERIQLAIADLKGGVDFGRIPDDLAALAWPVAKDPAGGLDLVLHVWTEIERRQRLMERAGTARVEVYNQRPGVKPLPYLFLFLDELMMLTMAAEERGVDKATRQQSAEFNGKAIRVVSVGRALGVSMIGATQRPSGTVIPTQLRDMCGLRLAFKCMTLDASKAVLGVGGAELLPADPGLALLMRDDAQPRQIRTYLAGLDSGKFDRFTHPLPRMVRLRLPADAEADGLGADDLPSSPGTGRTVLEPGELLDYAATAPFGTGTVPGSNGSNGSPHRIERRRPTPVEAAAMRGHYHRTGSKTGVCMAFYGYKNDDVWGWVEMALRGEI